MWRKKLHFKNSTYVFCTLLIAVMFFVANLIISNVSKSTRAEIASVNEQNAELEAQLQDLYDELAFIKTDEGIELYARANGMCMPGEVHYTVP